MTSVNKLIKSKQALIEQKCSYCRRPSLNIDRRHSRTAYEHEESNYITCCVQCYAYDCQYWDEMWAEYYASRGC